MTELLPRARTGPAIAAPNRARWLRLRLLAWPLYAAALGWYVSTYGVPYANDLVFLWLIGALIAGSIHAGGRLGWLLVLRDWVPVMAAVWAYSLLRGFGAHTPWPVNYRPQIAFDTFIGGGEVWTVRLQHWLYTPGHIHWYDYVAVTVYMSHFFAVFVLLAVLWKLNHRRFRRMLTLYLTVTFAGFTTYVLYPADPPWLAAQQGHLPAVARVVSAVLDESGLPRAGTLFENGSRFSNDVAAMPSLHSAYPMMIALFFWPSARRSVRVLLAAYPLAMAFTLVYGAEHFIIDILAGWLYAFAAWYLFSRRWRNHDLIALASGSSPVADRKAAELPVLVRRAAQLRLTRGVRVAHRPAVPSQALAWTRRSG